MDPKKRVVYIIHGLSTVGGMERVISMKANYLVCEGDFDVTIVTTDDLAGSSPNFEIDSSIKIFHLEIGYGDLIEETNLLKKIIRRLKLDYNAKQKITSLINKLNPDIIVSTYGHEVYYLHKIKTKAKRIVEYHFIRNSRIIKEREKGGSRIHNYYTRITSRAKERKLRKYDRFIVLTEEDKRNWADILSPIVIPNSIPMTPKKSALNNKKAIALGRLTVEKDFNSLIDVWALVAPSNPDWTLEIIGSGEEELRLKNKIYNLGLSESVIISPFTKNVEEKYLEGSVYISTSLYEGFSMVILEALNFGLPVVAFDCPCGPSEMIMNGKNGFLVENRDVSAMAGCISKLIEDDMLRDRMGIEAKRLVESYSEKNVMDRWIVLFNSL